MPERAEECCFHKGFIEQMPAVTPYIRNLRANGATKSEKNLKLTVEREEDS
jgi:hypothetical protein